MTTKAKITAALKLLNELSNETKELEPKEHHPAWFAVNRALHSLWEASDLLHHRNPRL